MNTLFCFGSVAAYFYALAITMGVFRAKAQEEKLERIAMYGFDEEDIAMMDFGGDGSVSRLEFVAYMLILLDKCKPHNICAVLDSYEHLHSHRAWKRLPKLAKMMKGQLSLHSAVHHDHNGVHPDEDGHNDEPVELGSLVGEP